ncbi:MAG: hypothetical protein VKJ64_03745, partial [Leptolyngbyaceae bacterium]|nr:hypothetical protein [Leptolyngbyaceae bacterium]
GKEFTLEELKNNADRRRKQQFKQMWQRNKVRKIRPVYWRRLVEVGVPVEVADVLAKAIAQYDASRQLPNAVQQHLISEYCRFVCRAELWRSQLLKHPVG